LKQRLLRSGKKTFGVREERRFLDSEHVREQHVRVERGGRGFGGGSQARDRRGTRLAPCRHCGSIVAP
jgi:hypothetical protein